MKHFFGVICFLAFGCWIAIGGGTVSPIRDEGPPTGFAAANPAGAHPIPAGARTPARIYNVTDYGAKGNGSNDDTRAIQAAIDAADSAPSGTVWFPNGSYKHTGLIVGSTNTSGNARQSHVSLVGENMIQTVLNYNGLTSGTAIRFQTNKYGAIRNLTISNAVAKGTTTGLLTAGPSGVSGTYSNGNLLEQVLIRGFHYGWATFASGLGTSSEIAAINLNLDSCDTGFYNNDFNGLNFTFLQLSISNCGIGIDASTAGVHVFGGAAANNTTDFHFANGGTNGVYNFRSETATQFVNNTNSSVSLVDCLVEPIRGATAILSAGFLELRNSTINGDVALTAACQLIMTDTMVTSSAIIKANTSQGFGDNRYRIWGCYLNSGSGGPKRVPDRAGILKRDGTLLDNFQFDSLGPTTPKMAFFSATPVAQQNGNAVTALSNYGLVTGATWPAASITGTNTLPDGVLSTNVSLLNAPSNNFTGMLQAGAYKSSDGTTGASVTTAGATFKNGLYVSGTITAAGITVTPKRANYSVLAGDNSTFFTNGGAQGEVDFTLPTAVAGRSYSFYVDAAQTIKIIAGSSTTIQVAGSTSAPAGNITNDTPGGCITLVAISTTKWVASSHEGTWTIK